MPDTYPREIQRRRAKRTGTPLKLLPAESGVTLADMFTATFLTPIKMLVTEPIVIGLSLYVGFIFGVTFQFFISIPAVLELTYGFTVKQVGIAFSAAILGSLLSTVMSVAIDFSVPHWSSKNHDGTVPEEYRMLPAMIGGPMVITSLFWIAWTAKPSVSYLSPIFGTVLYIWGAMSIIVYHSISKVTVKLIVGLDFVYLLPLRRIPTSRHTVGTHCGSDIPTGYCSYYTACDHPK